MAADVGGQPTRLHDGLHAVGLRAEAVPSSRKQPPGFASAGQPVEGGVGEEAAELPVVVGVLSGEEVGSQRTARRRERAGSRCRRGGSGWRGRRHVESSPTSVVGRGPCSFAAMTIHWRCWRLSDMYILMVCGS